MKRLAAMLLAFSSAQTASAQTAAEYCGQFSRTELEQSFARLLVANSPGEFHTTKWCKWHLGAPHASVSSYELILTLYTSPEHTAELAEKTILNSTKSRGGSMLSGIGDIAGYAIAENEKPPRSVVQIFAAKGAQIFQLHIQSNAGPIDNKTFRQATEFFGSAVAKAR